MKVMDAEMRRKLSGLLPFAPGSFARWTPDEFLFLEEAFRPVFMVRNFSSDAMKKYREGLAKPDAVYADLFREALASGALGGWENLYDNGTGAPINYTDASIATIPNRLAGILFSRCAELNNGPTEEEKTGLGSLPLPTSAE